MKNLAKRIGNFAGRALKSFGRPSRYRSNPKEIIRDNRQIRVGKPGFERKSENVRLERLERIP